MTEKAKDKAPEVAEKPAAPLVRCRVLRDFWPKEDERVRAGTIIELSAEEAMDGIESGSLSRVKG